MAKKKEEEKLPDIQNQNPDADEALEVIEPGTLDGLFARSINGEGHFKGATLKRTLTRPLIAMAHIKQLLWKCISPVYTMTLPARGRGAEPTPVRVVDGINVETADECTLIVNEMMASAFTRGGYASMKPVYADGALIGYEETPGEPLSGHHFAFKQGVMNEEKGYRYVDCVEVEVQY